MISKEYNPDSDVHVGKLFDNKERKNPWIVTRIKTNEEAVFEILFFAISVSIRTFVNHLQPLLIVDGAHLKGLYKGTNLLAVGMDGNNKIVPITYGICRGETGECWSWWFSILKEFIGDNLGDNLDLVIISNRHPAITLAISNQYPLAFHGICCRHDEPFFEKEKNKSVTLEHMQNLIQPEAYNKLIEAGVETWSRAHCPRTRYNYCTSNDVESGNAFARKTRKLPITMLTESYRSMVQKWYFKLRKVAKNMKYEITDWAADKVAIRKIKSATWIVDGINQYQYQVFDGRYTRQVNLTNRSREFRKWQLSGIPCGHVIVVTRFLGLIDCVKIKVDWFKKPKYQATHAEPVRLVREFHEWVFPDHIHPITPPRMDNPQPGRPKNTNCIPSQGEEPRIIHCSKCGVAGHKREQCKKPFVPDPLSNKRKTKNQQFPEYEYHETPPLFNPSQPYDHSFSEL
ncbi:hypothetical protein CTI12_AA200260 [Artemisia annua]|uniref:MULE transposase domain-containing protein n=1 Tax=Artemisia annua TaxID=35608 RepID=A0A2U1P2V4_ARTAN|nr:hypothetical protein CTI12_AA200260 [Artemisia annua]